MKSESLKDFISDRTEFDYDSPSLTELRALIKVDPVEIGKRGNKMESKTDKAGGDDDDIQEQQYSQKMFNKLKADAKIKHERENKDLSRIESVRKIRRKYAPKEIKDQKLSGK